MLDKMLQMSSRRIKEETKKFTEAGIKIRPSKKNNNNNNIILNCNNNNSRNNISSNNKSSHDLSLMMVLNRRL
jgi:hypothetical protein